MHALVISTPGISVVPFNAVRVTRGLSVGGVGTVVPSPYLYHTWRVSPLSKLFDSPCRVLLMPVTIGSNVTVFGWSGLIKDTIEDRHASKPKGVQAG